MSDACGEKERPYLINAVLIYVAEKPKTKTRRSFHIPA
jgi:hypothetical protein